MRDNKKIKMEVTMTNESKPKKSSAIKVILIIVGGLVALCLIIMIFGYVYAQTPQYKKLATQTSVRQKTLVALWTATYTRTPKPTEPIKPTMTTAPSDTPKSSDTPYPTATIEVTATLQTNQTGEAIQAGTQYVTMNNAQIANGRLQANFTIENKGTENIDVSSMMSFSAKDNEGTTLKLDIFNCPSGSLDGTVIPNDKLKGSICWTGLTTDSAKIYFIPDFLSGTVIVWEVKK
jgi:cytoskeletal protein RodZ